MKRVVINVSGKVQGVFFRASTKEKADELHISGTVRNNADDSVTVDAQGEEESIEQFVEWCKQGPPRARVDHFEITELDLSGGFDGFAIVT